jgi:hypothetical protein
VRGVIKGDSETFAKLVNKNAIKHQKGVTSPKNLHYPSQNLAKTSRTLFLDFQTVCIYGFGSVRF